MSSVIKKLANQTLIYGLSTILGRFLNYLLVPLYTYNFRPQEYGVLTEWYAYSAFLLIILSYGMETALFNFYNKEADKGKVFSTTLISIVSTSVLFFLLVGVFFADNIAGAVNYQNNSEYVLWFSILLSSDAIASIAFVKLRHEGKAKRFAFVKLVNILAHILLNLFFIVVCPRIINYQDHFLYPFVNLLYNPSIGIGYAFVSNCLASVFTLFLLIPEFKKTLLIFDFELWKRMIKYAFPLLIAGLAGMTNETMDRILLKYLLPQNTAQTQVGIYGACYKISIIMTLFVQAFRFAAEPFFFSQANQKDAKLLYADVMKYFVVICSIIFLSTMANISWIQYFIDKEYRVGINVVPILLFANLFLGIITNLSIWYKLTNKTYYGAYLTIFGALTTLLANFLLIPLYGYMGSAWATLICYASMMILSYYFGNKYYNVNYNVKRMLFYLALSLFLYCFMFLLNETIIKWNLIFNNIILIAFVVIVFFIENKELKQKYFLQKNYVKPNT